MRILAVIDDDMYYRNFIVSGAFNSLFKKSDFKISISDKVNQFTDTINKHQYTKNYFQSKRNKNLIKVFNQIAMRALRDKSTTLDLKIRKSKYSLKDRLVYGFFSLPLIFDLTKKIFVRKLEPNQSLEKVIQNFKPSLVLIPISGYESTSIELIMLSKKYNFKTFFLTNGWDNVSSKGILLALPDYLGVWGEQSLEHARDIQGIDEKKCFLLGCARYEYYFLPKYSQRKLFSYKYAVFAGSQTAHEEIKPLKRLDEILSKLKLKNFKIIYRPHPNREKRQGEDLFNQKEFRHVIIDPQVARDYYRNKELGLEISTSQNFPDIGYNPSLLKHAQFVISPLSSLIIEAAIYDVPSLILANQDDENPMSPRDHAQWTHFQGTQDVEGWFFGYTTKEVEKLFKNMLQSLKDDKPRKRLYKGRLSSSTRKFLFNDGRLYTDRLLDAIKSIKVANEYQARSKSYLH